MRKICCVLLLAACAGPADDGPAKDGGTVVPRVKIRISGHVRYHPAEEAWRSLRASPVAPPSVVGVTINVEDALGALANKPPLATSRTTEDGAFAFAEVDVTNVALGLVASVQDDAKKLTFSGYGLGRPPFADLADAPVFVVSQEFLAAVAAATSRTAEGLEEEGCVLGGIVDAEFKGIEGATLATATAPPKVIEDDLSYLNADLTGKQAGSTSASGLFILQPPLGKTGEYTAIKAGTTFQKKLTGRRPGAVVSLFVQPQVP